MHRLININSRIN